MAEMDGHYGKMSYWVVTWFKDHEICKLGHV